MSFEAIVDYGRYTSDIYWSQTLTLSMLYSAEHKVYPSPLKLGWPALLLFACNKIRFSHNWDPMQIRVNIHVNAVFLLLDHLQSFFASSNQNLHCFAEIKTIFKDKINFNGILN